MATLRAALHIEGHLKAPHCLLMKLARYFPVRTVLRHLPRRKYCHQPGLGSTVFHVISFRRWGACYIPTDYVVG